MAILGLTNQRELGFPRLGKIRKGDEKPASGPGKELDYFRFTVPEGREPILAKVKQLYGSQPKELRVWLPYETPEQNFDPWMKEYGTGSVKRICDGEKQVLWLPEGSATYKGTVNGDAPIPCVQKTTGCKCQRNAGLKVILAKLFTMGYAGFFDTMTSSKDDIIHITGILNYAYQFKQSLIGVPFIMRRLVEERSIPMKDKRVKKKFSMIRLEVDPEWIQKQLNDRYAMQMGLPPVEAIAALPSHSVEIDNDMDLLPSVEVLPAVEPPKAAADSPNKKRIKAIARLTGHKRDALLQLAADNNLPESSNSFTDEQTIQMVQLMLVSWAIGRGVGEEKTFELMKEASEGNPTDELLWAKFSAAIEAEAKDW